MKKYYHIANKSKDIADVFIYGEIAAYGDSDANSLAKQIAQMPDEVTTLNIYVNSPGGSVIEGIAIFNILKRSNRSINIYVDGLAASMAAVLTQLPNARRIMAKNTRLMIHSVSGMAFGTIDDLQGTIDMMKSFEQDLIDIIAERTGKTAVDVQVAWFDGKDHWFTTEEALEAGLVDEVIDGKLTHQPEGHSTHTLYNVYQTEITNYNSENNMKNQLIELFSLKTDLSENQVIEAIEARLQAIQLDADQKQQELTDKIEALNAQLESYQDAELNALIDTAIADKKITEAMRESFTALAIADLENAKKVIDSLVAPQDLSRFTDTGILPGIDEKRKDWTFNDWQKQDGKGLLALKEQYPDTYAELRKTLK